MEGFTGRCLAALPPRRRRPGRTRSSRSATSSSSAADDGSHRHRLVEDGGVGPRGDVITRPHPALLQQRRADGRGPARRRAAGDHLLSQRRSRRDALRPRGQRRVREQLRADRYGPGDYIVIPIGTTWRLDPDAARPADPVPRVPVGDRAAEALPQRLGPAARALARTPQRDIRVPDEVAAHDAAATSSSGSAAAAGITAYHYRHHPFDVVGWDGYLCPFIFNIGDFEPITGRVHQPPPVHQTFAGRNYVVCSFVPRKFDYHPLAIPAPYNHSNINSDEVIYYVAGNFMSRRGVDIARSRSIPPASRTGRTRARSRRRSARRRPRSWRSWSTRSTRSG